MQKDPAADYFSQESSRQKRLLEPVENIDEAIDEEGTIFVHNENGFVDLVETGDDTYSRELNDRDQNGYYDQMLLKNFDVQKQLKNQLQSRKQQQIMMKKQQRQQEYDEEIEKTKRDRDRAQQTITKRKHKKFVDLYNTLVEERKTFLVEIEKKLDSYEESKEKKKKETFKRWVEVNGSPKVPNKMEVLSPEKASTSGVDENIIKTLTQFDRDKTGRIPVEQWSKLEATPAGHYSAKMDKIHPLKIEQAKKKFTSDIKMDHYGVDPYAPKIHPNKVNFAIKKYHSSITKDNLSLGKEMNPKL